MSSLRIVLLGSLSATIASPTDPALVTHFRTQKTASLFAFLAFHAGVAQSREELIARFWPESDLDQGRMSLRTALSALRKDLGDALVTDKRTVTLHAQTDLQAFDHALRRAHLPSLPDEEKRELLRAAVELYGGPLLPGFYDDWVLAERDRLSERNSAALQGLTRWYDALGDTNQAIEYARRATIDDPLSEDLRAELIRLLVKKGNFTEALRQFEDLERQVGEHLGTPVSATLRALVAGLARPPVEELPGRVPAIALPIARGRFRGRREELSALVQRLSGGKSDGEGTRLFTLFGPGGIGKTRLAIEATRRLVAHGLLTQVYFVPLAEAQDRAGIWEGIVTALGMGRGTGAPEVEVRAHFAQGEPCLLVLDNVEQVALDAGELAAALLADTPNLTILTTSRRRLGTLDEELIAVGALPTEQGVALFVDRARSVVPEFQPTEADKETLRVLVDRLEGFPLAIELAAAWSSSLTPAEMLVQLEEGLLELPERADGPERHSSLRAAIRWSVGLLGRELRRAFFALSVFRGGWFASAALDICAVDRELLAGLRDRSLISAQAVDDQLRFSMHEALRSYGEKALSRRERTLLRDRHRAHFQNVAEKEKRPQVLAREQANFQRALEAARGESLVALCRALMPFWDEQAHWAEGHLWLEKALPVVTAPELRAEFHYGLGRLCFHLCDYPASLHAHQQSLAFWEERGDDTGMGKGYQAIASLRFHHHPDLAEIETLVEKARQHFDRAGYVSGQVASRLGLGSLESTRGRRDRAQEYHHAALTIAREGNDASSIALVHHRLGSNAAHLGQLEEAEHYLSQAARETAALCNTVGLAYIRLDQGVLAYNQGDRQRAHQYYQEALTALRECNEVWAISLCLGNLARLATESKHYAEAARTWKESLRIRRALGDTIAILTALDAIAHLLACVARDRAQAGCAQEGVCLQAASAALRQQLGMRPPDAEDDAPPPALLEALLGTARFRQAQESGAAESLEQAVARANRALDDFPL